MSTNRTVKGLLGKKLGMTQVWDENNKLVPVTVVEAGSNVVTQIKNAETDGYSAIQVAYGAIDPRKVNKPEAGHFAKAGVTPRRHIAEIRTADAAEYSVGQELGVETLEVGSKIDVVGTSKGKGFAGHMKRHGFAGVGGQTHGQHNRLRAPGSLGASSWPSKVFKGMRMAGRMGGDRVKIQNLEILKVYPEQNLLVVSGSVPGAKGSYVILEK